MSNEIINRVANSSLITLNLEDYYPKGQRVLIDLKKWLFQETILKEKDFRLSVNQHNWSSYQNQHIAIDCSVDAIIPIWAYMLISSKASPYAKTIVKGSLESLEIILYQKAIDQIDVNPFKNQKIIIKGCSNLPVCQHAYLLITQRLMPHAKSIMYGEACSSVPIFKKNESKNS
jgi:hypothetical protein